VRLGLDRIWCIEVDDGISLLWEGDLWDGVINRSMAMAVAMVGRACRANANLTPPPPLPHPGV
jgi:hypothetical protein